jgi:hypothetical protein
MEEKWEVVGHFPACMKALRMESSHRASKEDIITTEYFGPEHVTKGSAKRESSLMCPISWSTFMQLLKSSRQFNSNCCSKGNLIAVI